MARPRINPNTNVRVTRLIEQGQTWKLSDLAEITDTPVDELVAIFRGGQKVRDGWIERNGVSGMVPDVDDRYGDDEWSVEVLSPTTPAIDEITAEDVT